MTDQSNSIDFNQRNRKSWTQEEDNILIKLVKKYGVKRWTDISKAMVEMFDLHGKSGKQCRERWVNHLDPKINKNNWTLVEERKIFDSHKIFGNKWKIIAKQLDNRTDNSIKNHFYSILRKGLRRVNKMMGDRKSTQKVKEIRTSVLSKVCKLEANGVGEYPSNQNKKINVSNIYELLFQFSSMKSGNVSEKNLTQNIKDDFREMILHLMELSSQQKIKKQQNVVQNKQKKYRKNSSLMTPQLEESQMEDENVQSLFQKQQFSDQKLLKTNFTLLNSENKFLVNLQTPQKLKDMNDYEKYFIDNLNPQKMSQSLDQSKLKNFKSISSVVLEKQHQSQEFQEKCEELNIFPNITINLEQQSVNMSQSKDGCDFNLICFSNSPLFSTSRMFDQYRIRTPRVPSPGAFNFCGSISTAHSLGNYAALTGKQTCEQRQKSIHFDNELQKIVETLRSNINVNSNDLSNNSFLRVNSSKNSCIEPYLKTSYSSISLTPTSGKAN